MSTRCLSAIPSGSYGVLLLESKRDSGRRRYREQTHAVGGAAVTVSVYGVRSEQYAEAAEA